MSRLKLEDRYGYYRRCQGLSRNEEQCKVPAMKGEPLCHQHSQEAEMELRRQTMRQSFVLPPLRDMKTIQRQLGEVAKAIIEDRIDDDYAVELLAQLEKASAALRGAGG